MLIILSPAKSLDFESAPETSVCTKPDFLKFSDQLIRGLSNLSIEEIGALMSLSPKLSLLNHERFQAWSKMHNNQNSKQALLAFKGEVYEGLKAREFSKVDFEFAQNKLRILSGLYGVLRPLDLIQPYRLEMGTVYPNPAGKDLYAFWGNTLAESLNKDMAKSSKKILINLASVEYSKAAKLNSLDAEIISPVFKDESKGKFKIVSFYAKRARGMMAKFLITKRVESPSDIKAFNESGYQFCEQESTDISPVFKRSEKRKLAA